ncbi:MAG: hypothetical protein M1827_004385 [Pycnora praestabilis]|nr:MAG: hypothetical protein M1827_004385 [Pycnora praestabilis]
MANEVANEGVEPQTSKPYSHRAGDKDVPWFTADIEAIPEAARKLLETYSGIPSERVVPHILEVRERAWKIWDYPCIGQFRFLDLSISLSPLYPSIVQRVKDGQKLLDLGCCFAQDVRKLVSDGAPSENIYGADLRFDFIDLGYDLFVDRERLKTKFFAADIFDAESDLKEIDGEIDIAYTGSFFHLFDYDRQYQVAVRLVSLLRPRKGSLILGRQVGNLKPGSYSHRTNESNMMYRHDVASWKEMWTKVGEETGSEWSVDARLDEAEGMSGKGNTHWRDPNGRRMRFSVTRV